MKINRFILTMLIVYLLPSCSSNKFIVTNEVAYYPDDDSLAVMAVLKKPDSLGTHAKEANIDTVGDIPPVAIETETPDYPKYTMAGSSYLIEGKVFIKVWVTKEGKVKRAYIAKSSEKIFNKPCLEAAMQYKFKPAISKGKPISCWVMIPFGFRFHRP